MKITLIHNPGAGDGQDVNALVRLITDAGHDLRRRSTKQDWKSLLDEPTELVIAAGGDGTVRRVALEAASRCLPFSAIPIGTANNIAKTVGLLGEAADLIETWSPSPRAEHPFDLGEVTAPWGTERFVEGVGAGLVADLIGAYPGDGMLDVVRLRKADREPLHEYLESQLHLASGKMPELEVVRASEIEIVAPAGVRWHLDDHNWPDEELPKVKAELTVRCLPGALKFIAGPASFAEAPQAKRPADA
jgi:diacylglycerol kinase family enzyme